MKKVSIFTVVMVIAAIVVVILFLISSTASARDFGRSGGYHGGGHQGYYQNGGHRGGDHNGRIFLGGAIMAPFFFLPIPRVYAPACSNRVVSPGYYTFDYRGYRVWVPPTIVRECY